jgi:hypothetical protein
MAKQMTIAANTVCTFCFNAIPAGAKAWLEEDCRIECRVCHAEAERVKRVRELGKDQQDLFGS